MPAEWSLVPVLVVPSDADNGGAEALPLPSCVNMDCKSAANACRNAEVSAVAADEPAFATLPLLLAAVLVAADELCAA